MYNKKSKDFDAGQASMTDVCHSGLSGIIPTKMKNGIYI